MRASFLGYSADLLPMACEREIAIVTHDELKRVASAQRRLLDLIATRGDWQDRPVRR